MNRQFVLLISLLFLFACEPSPRFRPNETAKLVDKIWRVESYTKEFRNTNYSLRVDREDSYEFHPQDQYPGHLTRLTFNESTQMYDSLFDSGIEMRLEFMLKEDLDIGEKGDFVFYRFAGQDLNSQYCRPTPSLTVDNDDHGSWAWKDTDLPIMEVPPMAEVFIAFTSVLDEGKYDQYPGKADYEFTLLEADRFEVAQHYVVGKYEIVKRAVCVPISCEERDIVDPIPVLPAWTAVDDIPTPLINSVSAVANGEVFVMTGSIGESAQRSCWAYDIESWEWSVKPDVPGPERTRAVGFATNKYVFVGGGVSALVLHPYQDFWMLDTEENVWTQIADFPGEARFDATGFAIGNKGYVGAGKDWLGKSLKDFWEFDPANNTWRQIPNLPGAGRSEAIGFAIGDVGYVGLGLGPLSANMSDFWIFDPATDQWTAGPTWPNSGRIKPGVMAMSDRVVICGGREVFATGSNFYQDAWEYVPAEDRWTKKTDFPGSESYDFIGGGDPERDVGFLGGSSGKFWKFSPEGE